MHSSLRDVALKHFNAKEISASAAIDLVNILAYAKPLNGTIKKESIITKDFYKECEWRYLHADSKDEAANVKKFQKRTLQKKIRSLDRKAPFDLIQRTSGIYLLNPMMKFLSFIISFKRKWIDSRPVRLRF